MKNMIKNYASVNTPATGSHWHNFSDAQRVNAINEVIKNNGCFKNITIIRTHENGQVIVTLGEGVNAAERGGVLLDFEKQLKIKIDEGLNVWCEPIGDKNSLRKLRGIQIKT
jgi:hypothetical protein